MGEERASGEAQTRRPEVADSPAEDLNALKLALIGRTDPPLWYEVLHRAARLACPPWELAALLLLSPEWREPSFWWRAAGVAEDAERWANGESIRRGSPVINLLQKQQPEPE
jgi:hypothetical protein